MSSEGPHLGDEVGPRIRIHRLDLGLSLLELSKRSGVSVANISKIETGKIVGGFQTIYRICRGLGILVTDLLEENQPVAGPIRVLRKGEAEVQETALYTYIPLSTRPGGALNAAIMIVHSRDLPDPVDWSNHKGEEMVTVLSGSVVLHCEGQESVLLNEGDSANFEAGARHCYVCCSRMSARLLFVSTRPGSATSGEGM